MARGDFFSVKVTGRTAQKLDLLREALGRRPDRLTQAIRKTITERVLRQFATKTDPEGKRWRTWKQSTKAMRQLESKSARPYKRDPISLLEHTGAMKKSLFARTRGGQVSVGFGVSYAIFHETGTRNMRARRVLTDDGKGQSLARTHRIAIGIAVSRAIDQTLLSILK